MAEKLCIAIDLDGTMWAHPELFSEMARALKARGHSVGILTANHVSRERENRARLRQVGFPRPDFFVSKKTEELMIPPRTWKPRVMHARGIDYLFDDLHSNEIKLLTTREALDDGFRAERLWPRWQPVADR